jgi:adenylate kinase family enzyme
MTDREPARIMVVGCSASGKSTLTRLIADRYGLPAIHLDTYFWRPGWVQVPRDEWRQTCRELAAADRWAMDGNYGSSLDVRLPRAELIVFTDLSRWLCLYRALSRRWKYRNRPRPDIGLSERIEWQFLRYIWGYPRHHRGRLLAAVAEYAPDTPMVRLRSRRAVREFVAGLRGPGGV